MPDGFDGIVVNTPDYLRQEPIDFLLQCRV